MSENLFIFNLGNYFVIVSLLLQFLGNDLVKMNDERNFRSLYYEKVGCKGVEEKKSLEILFKDKTLDKNKIKQFCTRFTVPFGYRCFVWKFLLGMFIIFVVVNYY